MGDIPQRRDILFLVQLVMIRGWFGGGSGFGNSIARQNADYSGGAFLKIRFQCGKISISGELLVLAGASYVVQKRNQWYISSLNVITMWRYGKNVVNSWDWVLNVDGKGLPFLMLGNVGVEWKRRIL